MSDVYDSLTCMTIEADMLETIVKEQKKEISTLQAEVDVLKKKLQEVDLCLRFALCNIDHQGTRRGVKKARQMIEEVSDD